MALRRRADRVEKCPSLKAERKRYARAEFFLSLTQRDVQWKRGN